MARKQPVLRGQTVCVTGASGFVGYYLVSELVAKGAKVIGVDNAPSPSLARMFERDERYAFVQDDIRHIRNAGRWLGDADVVIHLAGLAIPRVCNANEELAFDVNVEGTKNVLHYSHKAQRFVFASSCMVYGQQTRTPIKESAIPNSRDVYSLTKLIGEHLCKIFHFRYKLSYTVLRFANSYGPHQAPDYLIPSLISQAQQEGKIEVWDPRPVRDFIFIKDTVEAIVRVLETDDTTNETINVGTGRGVSTKEIASELSRLMKVPWVPVGKRLDVPLSLVLDIGRINSLAGWSPRFSQKEGLSLTVKHYLQAITQTPGRKARK